MESIYDKRFKDKQVLKKTVIEKRTYRKRYYYENRQKFLDNIKSTKTTCEVCNLEIRKSSVIAHEATQQHLTNLWMQEDEDFMAWIKDITERVLQSQHLFRQQFNLPVRIYFD